MSSVKCQLCFFFGHIAPQCAQFHSSSHQPSTHLAGGSVSTSTWFPDTSMNQHFTPDLATLIDSAPYLGNDHLHVGDGKGLSISYIGHTMLCSPKHIFTLSNILHIPHITKPLLSVQKFYMIIMFILNFKPLCFM
jgi:histone deacetylase 1/2